MVTFFFDTAHSFFWLQQIWIWTFFLDFRSEFSHFFLLNLYILSKLPNSLKSRESELQICLLVKDVDPKDRDYEITIRKYKQILEKENLNQVITRVKFLRSELSPLRIRIWPNFSLKDNANQTAQVGIQTLRSQT
jgi:hypothetical protein